MQLVRSARAWNAADEAVADSDKLWRVEASEDEMSSNKFASPGCTPEGCALGNAIPALPQLKNVREGSSRLSRTVFSRPHAQAQGPERVSGGVPLTSFDLGAFRADSAFVLFGTGSRFGCKTPFQSTLCKRQNINFSHNE
jgi:hypothetical protein